MKTLWLMKSQFLFDIRTIVEMEDIPEDLVINWDHTGLNYVPVSTGQWLRKEAKELKLWL